MKLLQILPVFAGVCLGLDLSNWFKDYTDVSLQDPYEILCDTIDCFSGPRPLKEKPSDHNIHLIHLPSTCTMKALGPWIKDRTLTFVIQGSDLWEEIFTGTDPSQRWSNLFKQAVTDECSVDKAKFFHLTNERRGHLNWMMNGTIPEYESGRMCLRRVMEKYKLLPFGSDERSCGPHTPSEEPMKTAFYFKEPPSLYSR